MVVGAGGIGFDVATLLVHEADHAAPSNVCITSASNALDICTVRASPRT